MLFLVVLSVGTLWAYWRIHTYSTGQDPRTYLTLARGIAEGKGLSSLGGAVVPGWPLLLAGVIRLFGIYAAFWTNVPLFVLLIWVVQMLCADWTGSVRRGAAMAFFAALVLLSGFGNNPHYLLWAFRQTPMYLTSVFALLCLERAGARQVQGRACASVAWFCGSLLAWAGSISIRETGGLLLPAMGLYVLTAPLGGAAEMEKGTPRGARWRLVGMFFGSMLVLALGGAMAMKCLGISPLSSQGRFFLQTLPYLFGKPLTEWPLLYMMDLIPMELGVLGMMALGIGVGRSFRRRDRGFLYFLVLPALSYLLFDGLTKIHTRFILSTVFFLSPVVALGAMTCFEGLQRVVARLLRNHSPTWRRWAGRIIGPWGVWVTLGVWGVWTILHMGPWGARVSRAQVEHALELMRPYAEDGRPVVVDGRTRFLTDVTDVFTNWRIESVLPEKASSFVCNPPLLFVYPHNSEALHWAVTAPVAYTVLERHADLISVPGETIFFLDKGEYRMVLLHSWDETKIICPLPPLPEFCFSPPPPFLWLRVTAPALATDVPIRVSLGGRILAERLQPGYRFLAVPTEWVLHAEGDTPLSLEFEADTPLPSRFRPTWMFPDHPLKMSFGVRVQPSYESYLSSEFQAFGDLRNPIKEFPFWPAATLAREFAGDGVLYWPELTDPIADAEGQTTNTSTATYAVTLGLSSVYADSNHAFSATLTLPDFPDVSPQTCILPLCVTSTPARFEFGALPRAPRQLQLHVTSSVDYPPALLQNPRRSHYQLHSASLITRRIVDALHVPVGEWEDATVIGPGIFAREATGKNEHGRWTSGCAEIPLPRLRDGHDYQLQLTYDNPRPPTAPALHPRILFNGEPLELVVDPTTLTARLPADGLQETNTVQLFTTTWCPCDYGSADHRALGVYLREIGVTPL